MAGDAVAVLDAAGEERAHVYGISLGGMVAQEVALRHADRVRALVLGATTPGGLRRPVAPRGPRLHGGRGRHAATRRRSGPRSRSSTRSPRAAGTGGGSPRTSPGGRRSRPGIVAYSQQLAAAAGHTTLDRLDRIAAPTLVIHGEQDGIVPPENARLIADAIPGAELELRRAAGHLYPTDDPRMDRRVRRFLLRHTPERGGPRAAAARLGARVDSLRRRMN